MPAGEPVLGPRTVPVGNRLALDRRVRAPVPEDAPSGEPTRRRNRPLDRVEAPVGAGEVEAVQAITLRDDGGLWYQITPEGVWIRVDDTDYTTRGDCRP